MRFLRINIFLILAVLPVVIGAQTNQMLRSQGDAAMRNKDWHSAAQYYYRLFMRDSSNLRIQYRLAESSRLDFDLQLALRLYLKTAEYDNGRRYPLTFYWIGQIHKYNENYKEAKKWFQKFSRQKLRAEKYSYFKAKSLIEVEACDLAQILKNNPLPVETTHLDAVVNSRLSEYAALETADSSLYFSSVRAPDKRSPVVPEPELRSKIYKSEYKRGKWQRIKALDTTINSAAFHNANICFSPDGNEMILTRCNAVNATGYSCNLYLSKLIKKRWTTPQSLPQPVNQPSFSTTQACYGMIGGNEALFFASNRPGGQGGLDIWYSVKNDSGKYQSPVNAGKELNSADDEISPWYDTSKHVLYFSSTWHAGLGGFDVFKSNFTDGKFERPVNAGYPVNSSLNDVYYSENSSGEHLYVSSNRRGSYFENKLNCCNDIYRFTRERKIVTPEPEPEPVIDSVVVVKEQMKLLVPLTLYFNNDEPDPKTRATVTAKNYLETFEKYNAKMAEYIDKYSEGLKKTERTLAENRISNFFTDSLQAGMEALNKFSGLLEEVLEKGETVRITMKGYCSPLASTDYNVNLAKRRISSLRNYFKAYKNGMFMKYIENQEEGKGRIIFEDVDIGELPVSKVSDNVQDKRNSVYSPLAASERKIQVIAVSFGK